MIKSDKKTKELSILLSNNNNTLITQAIGLLRDEEPFEGAVGLLVSFYDTCEDNSVRRTIEEFMNDIKDQSVSREIITEIRKPYRQETISMLVSSCWQSGLDYSEYSGDLVAVFLRSDYVTSLECLTVIEESARELSLAKRNAMVKTIEEYPVQNPGEKSGLTNELISILKQGKV